MTGGLYPAIIQRELEKIVIPIPDLPVQARIVRVLTKAAEQVRIVRAEADKRIEKIESNAHAVLMGGNSVDPMQ